MLSKDAILEFQELFYRETGIRISAMEATQRGGKFMKLVKRVLVEINGETQNMKGQQVNDKQK